MNIYIYMWSHLPHTKHHDQDMTSKIYDHPSVSPSTSDITNGTFPRWLAGWQGIWGGFQRILKFFAGWWHDIPIIIMCTIVNLLCMCPWKLPLQLGELDSISIKWCVFTPIALLEERMKVWWAAHNHSLLFIYGQLVLESIRVVQNHFDKSKQHVASASKNKQPKGLVSDPLNEYDCLLQLGNHSIFWFSC